MLPGSYIQYIQDFFIDRGNFPDKQTRKWDELPSTAMRKLLSRIDHQVQLILLSKIDYNIVLTL